MGLGFARREPGWGGRPGNQSAVGCTPRAWSAHIQGTKHSLHFSSRMSGLTAGGISDSASRLRERREGHGVTVKPSGDRIMRVGRRRAITAVIRAAADRSRASLPRRLCSERRCRGSISPLQIHTYSQHQQRYLRRPGSRAVQGVSDAYAHTAARGSGTTTGHTQSLAWMLRPSAPAHGITSWRKARRNMCCSGVLEAHG
jgi:hypothetical protein